MPHLKSLDLEVGGYPTSDSQIGLEILSHNTLETLCITGLVPVVPSFKRGLTQPQPELEVGFPKLRRVHVPADDCINLMWEIIKLPPSIEGLEVERLDALYDPPAVPQMELKKPRCLGLDLRFQVNRQCFAPVVVRNVIEILTNLSLPSLPCSMRRGTFDSMVYRNIDVFDCRTRTYILFKNTCCPFKPSSNLYYLCTAMLASFLPISYHVQHFPSFANREFRT